MLCERKPSFGSHNNETESKMANYSDYFATTAEETKPSSSAVKRGMGDYHEG